jgi:hypothetical protein
MHSSGDQGTATTELVQIAAKKLMNASPREVDELYLRVPSVKAIQAMLALLCVRLSLPLGSHVLLNQELVASH